MSKKILKNYPSRLPLFVFAFFDLFVPLILLYVVHSLLLDKYWLEKYTWLGVLSGVSMFLGVRLLNGYSRYSDRSIAKKLELIFKTWFLVVVSLIFVAFLNLVAQDYSRLVILTWALITPFVLLALRLTFDKILYSSGKTKTLVGIIGNYDFTEFEKIRLKKKRIEVIKISLSNHDEIVRAIDEIDYDFVVIDVGIKAPNDLVSEISKFKKLKLIKMHQFMELFLRKCYVDYNSEDLSYFREIRGYSTSEFFLKRILDVVSAILILIITLPILIYSAAKIRSQSPGPIFFKQKRVGLMGNEFTLFKLRSMHMDAEKNGPVFATANDSRAFPYGAFMRKTRIDELPQLLNVIKGDIHIVGPRPERKVFVDELLIEIPFYGERHLISPGITGWAQVMFPYGSSTEDARQKLMYDLYYIKNWSIWLEIETLIKTFVVVFGKKGF